MATKRISFVITLVALALSCAPEQTMLMPRVYEIDWTPIVDWGLCDDWRLDDPDTLYIPTGQNDPPCSDPPEYPTNGVLQGRVQCDWTPGQDLFLTSDFYYELHTGGDAWAEITVEEPGSSAIPCYLRYEGTVTEL